MKLYTLEAVAKELETAGVRYLIAGGLAVNAHGYQRFTADIDIVIALDSRNIVASFEALARLGYRPSVPISAEQFTDARQREQWITEKNMQVLNFFSDRHPETSVDVFVYEPFQFDDEYAGATPGALPQGLTVRFVSIPALIQMKQAANRPRDLDDIQHLRWILEEKNRHD